MQKDSADESDKQKEAQKQNQQQKISLLFGNQNQDEDLIEKKSIVFSLKKLRQLMSKEEIQHLDRVLNCNHKFDQTDGYLQFLPYSVFPAIIQYVGQKYKCSCYQSLNSPNFSNQSQLPILKSPYQLANIAFPNLLVLNLSTHYISNIQSVAFIVAPKLRILQLYNNSIWNMDSLVKADFPQLQTITFYKNRITQMQQFYRFHSKKLRSYQFDCLNQHLPRLPFQDYRFLFKMQNPVPKKIRAVSKKRINIKNRPYFQILRQPGTQIVFYDRSQRVRRS